MMANEVWVYSKRFVSTPCKYINIPPQKHYQLFLLSRRQLSFDLKKLLWIIAYNNLLQILTFLLLG